jgi:cytosine/adenosine deaminase-related metal-dependent hydrolase
MTESITRKEFLRLAAAATTSTALAGYAGGVAAQNTASDAAPVAAGNQRRTLIRGADLLTMDPTLGEQLATDVLVDNGRVEAIGTGLSAEGAEVIDAQGMILMPGMIDGHRHVWETISMGHMSKLAPSVYPYFPWANAAVISMEPEDHYIAELAGGLQAVDSGVTSIVDFAHCADTEAKTMSAAQGLKESGIGGWFTFQLGKSTPPIKLGDTINSLEIFGGARRADGGATEEHWNTVDRLQQDLFNDSSAPLQLGLAPALGTGSPIDEIKDDWARVRSTGVQLLAAHMHKPNPNRRYPAGVMGHTDSGVPDLQDAGLLGPDYHVAHANRLTAEELQMFKINGCHIAATTMGEFPYMGWGAWRGPSVHGRARAAGVAVGIGMDVPLALPGDYFEHVRGSFWNQYTSPEGLAIANTYQGADSLDFVTALGAKAIRRGEQTGSITVGKSADLVLLSTDRFGFGTLGSLANRVVTFASREDIDSVWIAGQAKKRHGEMLGVDWSSIKARLQEAQDRVHQKMDTITWNVVFPDS